MFNMFQSMVVINYELFFVASVTDSLDGFANSRVYHGTVDWLDFDDPTTQLMIKDEVDKWKNEGMNRRGSRFLYDDHWRAPPQFLIAWYQGNYHIFKHMYIHSSSIPLDSIYIDNLILGDYRVFSFDDLSWCCLYLLKLICA